MTTPQSSVSPDPRPASASLTTVRTQPNARKQLEDLYRRYGPDVRRRCRRMLGGEAEDAVHEVFLRIATAFEVPPHPTETAFWIQRIARNYCLNELRGKRRRPEVPQYPVEEIRTMPGRAAELVAARDLVRRILFDAPDRSTTAAWLHYVDGFTQEEVGALLGLSRRTIITCLADLRERAIRASEPDSLK
jgi:RNA polymerase sigma-70 factor (ECF subfamily)